MKIDDLDTAMRLANQLREIERLRDRYRETNQLEVYADGFTIADSITCELEGFDPPSAIGACFRLVKDAMINLINCQIADAQRALRALGVDLSAGAKATRK